MYAGKPLGWDPAKAPQRPFGPRWRAGNARWEAWGPLLCWANLGSDIVGAEVEGTTNELRRSGMTTHRYNQGYFSREIYMTNIEVSNVTCTMVSLFLVFLSILMYLSILIYIKISVITIDCNLYSTGQTLALL